ncbi:MAG TPA: SET domain-containing protein [Chryseolinea sp.]|nr:SET domain-containing protein [Chryseolinea sp.]
MTSKLDLLNEVINNTYVVLRPSSVSGVGVFALRDIPKGCRDMFSKPHPDDNWIKIPLTEVENLPEHAKFLIWNYCLFDDENYFVPDYGFKKLDLCLFLNHSDRANVKSINGGDYFETTRDIAAGEELFLYYGADE